MISRRPTHPGAVLREEVLSASSIDKDELASKLSISRARLSDILNERAPVSAEIAEGLGQIFGNGSSLWLRMQRAFDAWVEDEPHEQERTSLLKAPCSPGEILDEFLTDMEISAAALDEALDLSPSSAAKLVAGEQPITRDLAAKLAEHFGTTETYWLNLQRNFDRSEDQQND